MDSLRGILDSVADREPLHRALATAAEQHVAGRGGVKGFAMKAGLAALKAAKPDIAERAARALTPELATALDPLYRRFLATRGTDFGHFLASHATEAAESVLTVTDALLSTAKNAAAKSLYQRFRGSAVDELGALLPTLGRLLARPPG